jgi:hypothetical protein
MGEAIGQSLPFAVGVALSPMLIVGVKLIGDAITGLSG